MTVLVVTIQQNHGDRPCTAYFPNLLPGNYHLTRSLHALRFQYYQGIEKFDEKSEPFFLVENSLVEM